MKNQNLENTLEYNIFGSAQALTNKHRQQIFSLLANKNNLSFNELKEKLGLPQSKLAYHLQILIKYNILNNYYDRREGIKDHSFYDIHPEMLF